MRIRSRGLRFLVVDDGGRGHALFEALCRSPIVAGVIVAPGNAGIPARARRPVKADDLNGLLKLAREERIDLTVVGPELPLVLGIADLFAQHGLKVFGPSKAAAQLEGSKAFCKQVCTEENIRTAPYVVAHTPEMAKIVIKKWSTPPVVKADGLCGGKGVLVSKSLKEAQNFVNETHASFGLEATRFVIEDRLRGKECSVMAFCDGGNVLLMDAARDYKRAFDNDEGQNTGGMGAYSPLPDLKHNEVEEIRGIINRLVHAMHKKGHPYHGVLYAGIMLTDKGPSLLEVNCRFGDPETQVVLPRLKSDLADIMLASTLFNGLDRVPRLTWKNEAAVCVVLTKDNYPKASHYLESWVNGIDEAIAAGAIVYHAGTSINGAGRLVSSGGRVLNVVGLGPNHTAAAARAYRGCSKIEPNELRYRSDIAKGV